MMNADIDNTVKMHLLLQSAISSAPVSPIAIPDHPCIVQAAAASYVIEIEDYLSFASTKRTCLPAFGSNFMKASFRSAVRGRRAT